MEKVEGNVEGNVEENEVQISDHTMAWGGTADPRTSEHIW